MSWKKPSEALVSTFHAVLPSETLAERRKMFGFPCAFVGGQMFAGLFEERLFVRLGEAERARLLALPDAAPFQPLPGRVMREYAVVPASMHAEPATLRGWVARAFEYAASLPSKEPRPRKRRSAGAPAGPAGRGRGER